MKKIQSIILCLIIILISACSHKSDKESIKVMTLNLRYDNIADSLNSWPKRSAQVASYILGEKPDLMGMQEVLNNQYTFLDSALTDYSSVGVGRTDGARGGEMNPVFFRKDRFDMIRTITFWLSNTPEVAGSTGWGASLPRIVTWMELVDKINHKHFFFFNTHFAHDSDSARVMSSKILLKEVESIAGANPFIITGDFNLLPASAAYTILTGSDESIPLLRDSFVISQKKPTGPLFTFNGFSDAPGAGRIDYIFVRDGMKVLEHHTVIKKDKGIYISDHWPVNATILLNSN
jgi:endonuclease/exonuclease/phosphatase family metal-dependent hydrolase